MGLDYRVLRLKLILQFEDVLAKSGVIILLSFNSFM
jgi:hypothetical protein